METDCGHLRTAVRADKSEYCLTCDAEIPQEGQCRYCLRQHKLNRKGYCNAACQRAKSRAESLQGDLMRMAYAADRRMAITIGQAVRAHGEQLAKDADEFKAEGATGLERDFRQRAKWMVEFADVLDGGP